MNEKIKDNKIAVRFSLAKFKLSEIIIFVIPKKETAPKIGIESKNAILAASTLLNFNILAAVMAIPDLLTPGTNEKICKILMKNTDFNLKSVLIFFSNLNLSLKNSNKPKIIVVHAIILKSLISYKYPVFAKIYPIIITGSDASKILKKRILF